MPLPLYIYTTSSPFFHTSKTHFLKHTQHFLRYISFKSAKTMPEAPKNTLKTSDYNLAEKNKISLQFIEDVTSNADEVQKKVLEEILSRNAHVEYLQRHGLNGQTNRETFKKAVPVITYEDIQPDINRIANGDTSQILCSKPISEFLTRWVCASFFLLVTRLLQCFGLVGCLKSVAFLCLRVSVCV